MSQEKMSKGTVQLLMTNIPNMIQTLVDERVEGIDEVLDTWERFKREGARGGQIIGLYNRIKVKLPEKFRKKYY